MDRREKPLLAILLIWCLWSLLGYYFTFSFFRLLYWLFTNLVLSIAVIVQLVQLIRERKMLDRYRIAKALSFAVMLLLSFTMATNTFIEKMDWLLLSPLRTQIVEEVKEEALKPNVSWNSWVSELPYEFPPVSNGGNDIGIFRGKDPTTVTVSFWIHRNFFEAPSTSFIYTNDPAQMEAYEKRIRELPDHNWKLRDNWYRISGR